MMERLGIKLRLVVSILVLVALVPFACVSGMLVRVGEWLGDSIVDAVKESDAWVAKSRRP